MNEMAEAITLKLEGRRAERGMALSDFETFIENFIAALRDFDRDQRGAPTKKSGHPEARAEAVAAFRLVGFREGSGIATIEPEQVSADDDMEPLVATELVQVANLRSLLAKVDQEERLPASVTDSLEKAIRAAGDDGTLSVECPSAAPDAPASHPILIDGARLARIRRVQEVPAAKQVTSISGRLHQVDFEPDKLAIRASDGVDWICSFSEDLENTVEALVNRLVWASGSGELQSPRRGTMQLVAIKGIEQGLQTGLFAADPVPAEDLATAQGITRPQGLAAVGVDEWTEADEAYLSALTND
jgi:hypothetical protein